MKKVYLFLAGVLVSAFAFAGEPGDGSNSSGLAVIKKNETTFNLFYQSAGSANVKVSILDSRGRTIFSELVKNTDGFVRPYNFSALGKGEYSFSVNDGDNQYEQKMVYGETEAPKLVNVVKLANNKYLLTIPGNKVSGKVKINVYDGIDLVHQQTQEITKDFGQLYKLNEFQDHVSFEVIDSNGKRIN